MLLCGFDNETPICLRIFFNKLYSAVSGETVLKKKKKKNNSLLGPPLYFHSKHEATTSKVQVEFFCSILFVKIDTERCNL